jgi:hypothetical protein
MQIVFCYIIPFIPPAGAVKGSTTLALIFPPELDFSISLGSTRSLKCSFSTCLRLQLSKLAMVVVLGTIALKSQHAIHAWSKQAIGQIQ